MSASRSICQSVREFIEIAFQSLGMTIRWEGRGLDEKGYDVDTDKLLVEIDPRYFRPTEVDTLLGNANRARTVLNWKPERSFTQMVEEMILHDLALARFSPQGPPGKRMN